MKLSLKLLLFTLVLALGAPFILKDEDGRPLMDTGRLHMPALGTPPLPALDTVEQAVHAAGKTLAGLGDGDSAAATIAYKWRDAAGNWHFADEAPPGVSSERVVIGGDSAAP